MKHFAAISLLILSLNTICHAWDTEELEIFDLVEEINQNFYTVLNVEKVCITPEQINLTIKIKKRFTRIQFNFD